MHLRGCFPPEEWILWFETPGLSRLGCSSFYEAGCIKTYFCSFAIMHINYVLHKLGRQKHGDVYARLVQYPYPSGLGLSIGASTRSAVRRFRSLPSIALTLTELLLVRFTNNSRAPHDTSQSNNHALILYIKRDQDASIFHFFVAWIEDADSRVAYTLNIEGIWRYVVPTRWYFCTATTSCCRWYNDSTSPWSIHNYSTTISICVHPEHMYEAR